MSFVKITVGHLLAVDRSRLDKSQTIDEVLLKNLEAHEGGSPATVLNVSEAVANRIKQLAGEDPAELERAEADRLAAEKAEADRVAAEKAEAEKAEADRLAAAHDASARP